MLPFLTYATEEETPESRYSRAIALRDENTKESMALAESLFLELSNIEHPKKANAQHNYASIQYKNGNYKLAYVYFLNAGLKQSLNNAKKILEQDLLKQDLYLVVGSDRGGTITGCESYKNIAHIVHGLDVDVSPLRIFGEAGTTLDLRPSSKGDAKHIVGDVQMFDFSKKYNIKHVLFERFPTSSQAALEGRASMMENYAGACIQQISKAMKCGAILEYEWDPYLEFLDASECQNAIFKNPFTGFLNFNEICQGIQALHTRGDEAGGMAKKINEQLVFFHQQGLGKDVPQLIEKLYWEVVILQKLLSSGSIVSIACNLEKANSDDHVAEFINAAKLAEYGKQLRQIRKIGSNENYVYDSSTFIARTYLNFIAVHMAAETNAPYVESYLKTIGFADVSIARKTNSHNGRKNTWMIHATKA